MGHNREARYFERRELAAGTGRGCCEYPRTGPRTNSCRGGRPRECAALQRAISIHRTVPRRGMCPGVYVRGQGYWERGSSGSPAIPLHERLPYLSSSPACRLLQVASNALGPVFMDGPWSSNGNFDSFRCGQGLIYRYREASRSKAPTRK